MIHLNGAPAVGKSTLARRWASAHPGTLDLDIDVLRTLVGGWDADFAHAGALVRPVALAAITTYVAQGGDVVLPQLIARPEELARFRGAAEGATYHHVVLTAAPDVLVQRFHARPASVDPHDPASGAARQVGEHGGDALLRRYRDDVHRLAAADPTARFVETIEGDLEATYAAVRAAIG